jgi:hypothetical protein
MTGYTPDQVLKMQLKHKCAFWKITDRSKREVKDEVVTDIGLDASYNLLEESFNDLKEIGVPNVFITLYSEKPVQREKDIPAGRMFTYDVVLNNSSVAIGTRNNNYTPSYNEDYFKKLQEIHQERMNLEIEKVRLELTAIEKPTFLQRIGEKFETLITNEQIAAPVIMRALDIIENFSNSFDNKKIGSPAKTSNLISRVNKLGLSMEELDKALTRIESNEELKTGFAEQIKNIANG